MAFSNSRAQGAIGMKLSYVYPITDEPANSRPTYGSKVDMGAAVKGYLSVTTASASVPGDDISQIDVETFTGGQFDAETTMNALDVNGMLFGHRVDASSGEISHADDVSPNVGYGYVQSLLKKDKTQVFRAVALLKLSAMASTEKDEADTKKPGDLSFKNYAVSFKVMACESGEWRVRKDFATQAEAEAYLDTTFGQPPAQST